VIQNIKEADGALDTLKQFLDSDAKILWLSNEIDSILKKQKELSDKSVQTKERGDKLLQKKEELKRGIEKNREELEKVMKDPEWDEINRLSSEIEQMESKALEIKQEITEKITSIKRPLKKLEHLAQSSYQMRRERQDLLRDFMSEPFKAIMARKGELDLKDIITELNDMIKLKKLMLKSKEQEKMLELARKLETEIPWMKEKYEKLVAQGESKKKEKEERAPDLTQKAQSLESSIEGMKQELDDAETELKGAEKEKIQIREALASEKANLEKIISENTEYEVKIED
jgi:chromosome segregation ATPase